MNHGGMVIARAPGPVWRPDTGFVQDDHNATCLNCILPARPGGRALRDHFIGEERPNTHATQAPGPMSGLKGSWSTASVANPFAQAADAELPQAPPIPSRTDEGSMSTQTRTTE